MVVELEHVLSRNLRDFNILARTIASAEFQEVFDEAVSALVKALSSGRKVMAAGNGGSLSEASHFVEEFSGRFRSSRKPLAAISLTDSAAITCIGNDFGFENIFSRQVEAIGDAGDVLVLFSTSGSSRNLLAAASVASKKNIKTVALLGKESSELSTLCDICLEVGRVKWSDRVQELHQLVMHSLVEDVELRMGLAK